MTKFNILCDALTATYAGRFTFNRGKNYIGLTFNSYEQMWDFMKSSAYKDLRPYRVLSRYTKFLLFECNA